MKEFTDALFELFVKQNIELAASLLIMSKGRKKGGFSVTGGKRELRAAAYIYECLENGNLFSNSLKTCPVISFDAVYIAFVRLAEKNGDLRAAITYLHEKLERNQKNQRKIFMISVYPVFVVITSIVACIFIGLVIGSENWLNLINYVFVLILICAFLYFCIFMLIGDSKLSEAFMAVDFLVKKGIDVAAAVECAVQIAGPSSTTGRKFEDAKKKLEYGMNLQTAFSCRGKIGEAFYYADVAGNQNDIFSRVALYLNEENEKRRSVCMALVEPVFILVVGIFLMSLLMEFFMPYLNGFGIS